MLDEFGELVTDLTEDDFTVLDDGEPQKLTLFASTFQPITAALLVDTSASMALSYDQAAAAAEQFVIRLLPEDRARVGSFADKVRWATEMTGDRDALLRGLRDALDVGNPSQVWDSIDQTRGRSWPRSAAGASSSSTPTATTQRAASRASTS